MKTWFNRVIFSLGVFGACVSGYQTISATWEMHPLNALLTAGAYMTLVAAWIDEIK